MRYFSLILAVALVFNSVAVSQVTAAPESKDTQARSKRVTSRPRSDARVFPADLGSRGVSNA